MRNEAGAVCLVAPGPGRLSGFAGREVHVLDVEAAHRAESPIGEIHDCPVADRSESVRRALETLHARHRFAEIHFPLLGGLAFRTLQARNAGLAFEDVEIVVRADATSRQEREKKQSWPAGPDDLVLDYMEEYCVEACKCSQHLSPAKPGERCWSPDSRLIASLVTVGIAHYNLGQYLPAALKSLAEQTYRNLEIVVIDDGSTQAESVATIQSLARVYPQVRFIRRENVGIGAARNWLLAEANGEYFLPMDADNLARPNMVEAFVRALEHNRELSAMSCYFRAFAEEPESPLYAYRPTGGPHVLACIRNVYGDANGIFRTADFRAIGGYETDRGTSCEDWEAYVKLIHAGKRIDVVPEYLFDYRHRESGFSRATNWFANHQRVMRQFREDHWSALLGFQQENVRLKEKLNSRRYRVADALTAPFRWLKQRS